MKWRLCWTCEVKFVPDENGEHCWLCGSETMPCYDPGVWSMDLNLLDFIDQWRGYEPRVLEVAAA